MSGSYLAINIRDSYQKQETSFSSSPAESLYSLPSLPWDIAEFRMTSFGELTRGTAPPNVLGNPIETLDDDLPNSFDLQNSFDDFDLPNPFDVSYDESLDQMI